jgi:demethylmenaquinone methyltransferase/2-methoxy-6-polyprenyl-1,4-benzoquinol methylase
LDVCTGTGEMAHYLKRYAGRNTIVVGTDFALPMLRYATDKKEDGLIFTFADSARLPFENKVFDLVTISFATRNINTNKKNLIKCLREFYRVLKPDGRFINLAVMFQRKWDKMAL